MPGPPPEVVKPYPCLSFGAAELFKHFADQNVVVEFGSGGSTLWMSQFVWTVHSFETDAAWFQKMSGQTKSLQNVAIEYVDQDAIGNIRLPSFNVAFVDSFQPTRRPFLLAALRNAKPGCVIVADDSHFANVARTLEELDRSRYYVEELIGRKSHPIRGEVVQSHTAFIRVL